MRILTLTNGYPPHYYGGYELTCFDVMQRFMSAGHEVTVLTSTARVPGIDTPDTHDVRRTLIPFWDWETNRRRQAATPLGWRRDDLHNLDQLSKAIDQTRPDAISVWHMIGLSMSLLSLVGDSGLPTVVTVGNDWLVEAPDFDPWHRLWGHWPLKQPRSVAGVPVRLAPLDRARINFVSDFVKQHSIKNAHWRVDPDSPVVPPGIDLDDFPITARRRRSWSWQLLYVGRVDPVKGVATLIHAFAMLPTQARLEIVGGGPHTYIAEMKELADQLGVSERVVFTRCPRHELRDKYLASDVVVFPSEWDEPFGLVPIEAMASGVPVVATATGGAAEFLRDRANCLLFPPGDASSLAEAVRTLAGDADLVATLTANGTDTANTFTIGRYADRLLELHQAP